MPWEALYNFLALRIGTPTVDGRLLLPLDETTYEKNDRHIAGELSADAILLWGCHKILIPAVKSLYEYLFHSAA